MISYINGKEKLTIFENFSTDWNLPKFKNPSTNKSISSDDEDSDDEFETPNTSSVSNFGTLRVTSSADANCTVSNSRQSWFSRLVGSKRKKHELARQELADSQLMNPSVFFENIQKAMQGVEIYTDRLNKYDDMVSRCKQTGQTALLEKLSKAKEMVVVESALLASGNKKFISEADVIGFVKLAKKGVRLDWIKNFCRMIPSGVAKAKSDADLLRVFDNYVIMHYDPQMKSYELTKAEIDHIKDPIVFGVVSGIRKLYYIADWKDDVCDLTLEELNNVLGHETGFIEKDFTLDN